MTQSSSSCRLVSLIPPNGEASQKKVGGPLMLQSLRQGVGVCQFDGDDRDHWTRPGDLYVDVKGICSVPRTRPRKGCILVSSVHGDVVAGKQMVVKRMKDGVIPFSREAGVRS